MLVIRPMADGVGVTGGGFVGVFATFRLLFGVVGGGIAALPEPVSIAVESWTTVSSMTSSEALL